MDNIAYSSETNLAKCLLRKGVRKLCLIGRRIDSEVHVILHVAADRHEKEAGEYSPSMERDSIHQHHPLAASPAASHSRRKGSEDPEAKTQTELSVKERGLTNSVVTRDLWITLLERKVMRQKQRILDICECGFFGIKTLLGWISYRTVVLYKRSACVFDFLFSFPFSILQKDRIDRS